MYKLGPFTYTFSQSLKPKKIFLENEIVFNQNDTIAIIGPSGGGKSTLLKVLKGIIPEYSSGKLTGEVSYNGKPLSGESFQDNLQKILYLFQNPFSQLIYPTTEEEFLFSMENFNFTKEQMNEEKEKFEKLLGLKNIWGKKTSELSNGECQKLVLASLLAINPEVLLLDEPTAFLDPEARREFYEYLNILKKDRILIIVDHHVDEIRPLINKVIFVDQEGRISPGKFTENNFVIENVEIPLQKTFPEITLSVNDMSFFYHKERELLKNINVSFKGGEVIAIKGKNGEGKSTFFKLLSGILKPNSGNVEMVIDKKSLKNNKIFSEVGFIFQNPEAHFFFDSIEEELKQSFKFLPEKDQHLKDDLLKRFFHDIDLKKSPFLLSEGEKRRLSILMTVFLNKGLILYDEPTFGQDQKSIKEIEMLIRELKKLGLIQIFISHDETFIKNTADRVFILDSGRLNEIS